MESVVHIAGVVLGALALLTVYYAWGRQKQFGLGGAVLSVIGMVLIGLPLWSAVSIKITLEGLEAELERTQEQLERVSEATALSIQTQIDIAENVKSTQEQFIGLTRALEQPGAVTPAQLQALRRPFADAAPVNQEELRRAILMVRPRIH